MAGLGTVRKLAAVAAAFLLTPVPAPADGGAFRDGDEQPFCESPGDCPDDDYIDFRRVTFGHGRRPALVRHGIRTMKRWKTKDLGGPHGVTFFFHLDTDGDRGVERALRVRRKNGHLWGGMFRGKHLRRHVRGRVEVWRPDRRSLEVRFPVRMLGDDVERYRWQVSWAQRQIGCPGSCHSDHAPGRGWYEHRL